MSKTKNTKLILIAFIYSRVTAMFIRMLIKHKKRLSGLIYEEYRRVLQGFFENMISDAVTYTEHAERKTEARWTLYTRWNDKDARCTALEAEELRADITNKLWSKRVKERLKFLW